jgi:hypothetical protein
MAENPGVPRQEAKRRVDSRARMALLVEDMRKAAAAAVKVFGGITANTYVDHGR